MIHKIILIISIVFFTFYLSSGQCPDNVDDFIIISQEDWDYYTTEYPHCEEWQMRMINGKFIGHPQRMKYLASLFILLALILGTFKLMFRNVRKKSLT